MANMNNPKTAEEVDLIRNRLDYSSMDGFFNLGAQIVEEQGESIAGSLSILAEVDERLTRCLEDDPGMSRVIRHPATILGVMATVCSQREAAELAGLALPKNRGAEGSI